MTSSSPTSPVPTSQAEAMRLLRAELDPLIALVGEVTEVTGDGPLACDPGNDSAGFASTYQVRLRAEPGALQKLTSQIAPEMKAKGWRVEQSARQDEGNWYFRRDGFALMVFVGATAGDTAATAGGAAPCLPKEG